MADLKKKKILEASDWFTAYNRGIICGRWSYVANNELSAMELRMSYVTKNELSVT